MVRLHDTVMLMLSWYWCSVLRVWVNYDLLLQSIQALVVVNCNNPIALWFLFVVAKVVAKVPFTPGHEMVGEVNAEPSVCMKYIHSVPFQIVAVGPNVPPDYAIGKRVCVENHFYCGDCYQCKHSNAILIF